MKFPKLGEENQYIKDCSLEDVVQRNKKTYITQETRSQTRIRKENLTKSRKILHENTPREIQLRLEDSRNTNIKSS